MKGKRKHIPLHFLCHICFSGLQVYEKIASTNIIEDRETILILLCIQIQNSRYRDLFKH